MTDRELLELAAKAAGYEVYFENAFNDWYPKEYDEEGNVDEWWNPLTDDGDALRLACTLGLVVDCSRPSAGLPFYLHAHAQLEYQDLGAAVRRCIVRAAAEIGRSKHDE